jgi:RHS repeat-associated protein
MEVSESIVCLQLYFEYYGSAPLVQQSLPAKSDLENCYSFNVVFSSETSMYRFTGKPVSQTTGLYYYGARWYDPTVGRFISQDPLKGRLSLPQTLNPYIYVEDSPTSSTDPTGMADCNWNPLSWGGCAENAGGAAWNGVTTAGNDIAGGASTVSNTVINEWNNDPNFRTAVILTVATVAIVATAGIAAPAVLPTIAIGIGLGAGISTGTYVGTTLATGGKITASGLFLAASTGAFIGAATAGAGEWISAARGAASAASSLESVADSEAESGVNLSSHFLQENHLYDIAKAFTGYGGNTGDAMSLISDTLDSGSFNEARSSVEPLQLVYEKVYASSSGPYGLRAVWDVVSQSLWTAYPFPVVD